MSVLGWILAGLLAFVYVGAGLAKASTPREKLLANPQMGWVADYSATQVRIIGGVEVLGAIGLVLPWLLNIAAVLTPIAAIGLAIVQALAFALHLRRHENKTLPVNVVLLVLAVVVAVIRFGQL